MTPTKPGIYHFKGVRTTPSKKFIISIDDYVRVQKLLIYPELMVSHFGTGKLHGITTYTGEWQLVREEERDGQSS